MDSRCATVCALLACGGHDAATPAPPPLVAEERASVLAGRVTAPGGAPIAARVEVVRLRGRERLAQAHAAAGADGRFRIAALPRGDFLIVASAEGHARAIARRTLMGDATIDLSLGVEAPILGRVLDAEGRPLAGASIEASRDDEPAAQAHGAADGSFRLGGLAAGRATLRASAPGFAQSERTLTAPSAGMTIVLARLVAIEGRVTRSGAPHAATVACAGSGLSPLISARAGPDGRFRIDVREGIYDLAASSDDGFASRVVAGVDARGAAPSHVAIALEPAGALTGVVRDAHGAPIVGALVTTGETRIAAVTALDPRLVTDAAGHFRFAGLVAGAYRVDASAAGFRPATQGDVTVTAGGVTHVVLQLDAGARITGVVIDSRDRPVAGAEVSVTVTGADGKPIDVGTGATPALIPAGELGVLRGPIPFAPPAGCLSPSEGTCTTTAAARALRSDGAGRFVIAGLPPGRARVRASAAGYVAGESAEVALDAAAAAPAEARVVLRAGGVVAGRVRDGEIPLPGAIVEAQADGGEPTRAITDALGDYALAGLLGRVTLRASSDGYEPGARVVQVAE
ncbi:MAG: carboxypeptidase-like regulatory domain-containing protein, partial [Myxococcota bacterium]